MNINLKDFDLDIDDLRENVVRGIEVLREKDNAFISILLDGGYDEREVHERLFDIVGIEKTKITKDNIYIKVDEVFNEIGKLLTKEVKDIIGDKYILIITTTKLFYDEDIVVMMYKK